jgi:hypothetical protein
MLRSRLQNNTLGVIIVIARPEGSKQSSNDPGLLRCARNDDNAALAMTTMLRWQ